MWGPSPFPLQPNPAKHVAINNGSTINTTTNASDKHSNNKYQADPQ